MKTPTGKGPVAQHDPCDRLLSAALSRASGPTLWVVDEHIATPSHWPMQLTSDVTIVSNRYDSYLDAQRAGLATHFNDMDLAACRRDFASVVYRISKEKALVHHVINAAKHVLQAGGELLLVGGKQEGIKTYIDKAEAYLGPVVHQENGDHSTRLACLQKASAFDEAPPLDDKDYRHFRLIGEENRLQFFSKPGQFGWDKLDQGSQFLVAHFDACFATRAPGSVLDLGCGYGYLALQVSRFNPTRLVATDNNAAALASCQYNLAHNAITLGEVMADDCGKGLRETFDTVICNPPFHQGFGTSGELTDRFLAQTRRLLKPSGVALFVVNQFIPLEQKAATLFRDVETFARNKSFKLVKLAGPR